MLFPGAEHLTPFDGTQTPPPEAEQVEAAELFVDTINGWQDEFPIQSMAARTNVPNLNHREMTIVNDWRTVPGREEVTVRTVSNDDGARSEHEIVYRYTTQDGQYGYNYGIYEDAPQAVQRHDSSLTAEAMWDIINKIKNLNNGIRSEEKPNFGKKPTDEALPNLTNGIIALSEVQLVLNSIGTLLDKAKRGEDGIQALSQHELMAYEDEIDG
jgi:hypothetical protein